MVAALAIACAVLALIDVASTRYLLRLKGFYEGGPVWGKLELSPDLLLVAQLAAYGVAGWLLWAFAPRHPSTWLPPVLILAYAVASNLRKVRSIRG